MVYCLQDLQNLAKAYPDVHVVTLGEFLCHVSITNADAHKKVTAVFSGVSVNKTIKC